MYYFNIIKQSEIYDKFARKYLTKEEYANTYEAALR